MQAERARAAAIAAFVLVLVVCLPAFGQSVTTPKQQTTGNSQLRPLPLPDLYRVFLMDQNYLDNRADTLKAHGKDGKWMRDYLQNRLHFSNADYAPIREAARQLGAEMQDLDKQAATIRKSGDPFIPDELRTLAFERRQDVDDAVYNLKWKLSAHNKAVLEAFITEFFAPKPLTIAAPAAGAIEGVRK